SDPIAPVISPLNGDANFVLVNGTRYYLPNNVADGFDIPFGSSSGEVLRDTAAVAGRWGEADLVPGSPGNPLAIPFNNPVRAGRSPLRFDPGSQRLVPWDADDDNFNTFDPYPTDPYRIGEAGDTDFYDQSGGLVLPVEWMRRFVTPIDVDGSGR